jgi:HTH-type transcriptional regulator/antitoxin HigA
MEGMSMATMAPAVNPTKYKRLVGDALPHVIGDEAEYKRLLGIAEKLMEIDEKKLSPEQGQLLELLSVLIEQYEDSRHPLPKASPRDMLVYLMEEKGVEQREIAKLLGSRSRTSEILAGKRGITKDQSKLLAERFNVPVELFL